MKKLIATVCFFLIILCGNSAVSNTFVQKSDIQNRPIKNTDDLYAACKKALVKNIKIEKSLCGIYLQGFNEGSVVGWMHALSKCDVSNQNKILRELNTKAFKEKRCLKADASLSDYAKHFVYWVNAHSNLSPEVYSVLWASIEGDPDCREVK